MFNCSFVKIIAKPELTKGAQASNGDDRLTPAKRTEVKFIYRPIG